MPAHPRALGAALPAPHSPVLPAFLTATPNSNPNGFTLQRTTFTGNEDISSNFLNNPTIFRLIQVPSRPSKAPIRVAFCLVFRTWLGPRTVREMTAQVSAGETSPVQASVPESPVRGFTAPARNQSAAHPLKTDLPPGSHMSTLQPQSPGQGSLGT